MKKKNPASEIWNDSYNNLPCGIVMFSTDPNFSLINANTYYTENLANGNTKTLNVSSECRAKLRNRLQKSPKGNNASPFYCVSKSSDGHVYTKLSVKFIPDSEIAIAILTDITSQYTTLESLKAHEAELRHKIETDPLCNVYTRDAAISKINRRISKKSADTSYALMVLDIDNFKSINDNFGHLYGDAIISMVANFLKRSVSKDDIIGRFGGDEFFIFMKNNPTEELIRKASKINQLILNLRADISNKEDISMSIGIATSDKLTTDVSFDALFENSDKALYRAKENGKNCYVIYDHDMSAIKGRALNYANGIDDDTSNAPRDITSLAIEIVAKSNDCDSAIHNVMRHVGLQFGINLIQLMYVDCHECEISIEHEWSFHSNLASKSSKSGFYRKADIDAFIKRFKEKNYISLPGEDVNDFTDKMKNEFAKLSAISVLYCAAINNNDNFTMLVYQCPESGRQWTHDELNTLIEITKILTVFINRTKKHSQEQLELKRKLDFDEDSGLYSFHAFLRKASQIKQFAIDNSHTSAIVYIGVRNFSELFKQLPTYVVWERIMHRITRMLKEKYMDSHGISTIIAGSEHYAIACRSETIKTLIETLTKNLNSCFDEINAEIPNANVKLGVTINVLEPSVNPFDTYYAAANAYADLPPSDEALQIELVK